MKTYEIDGERFSTVDGFFEEIGRVMNLVPRGHNLDAFNDILRGGFGTPEEGFTIVWKNHAISKRRLGYEETVRRLDLRLKRCHPANKGPISMELGNAKAQRGETAFDWLVEIIRVHGNGGTEEQDRVELILE